MVCREGVSGRVASLPRLPSGTIAQESARSWSDSAALHSEPHGQRQTSSGSSRPRPKLPSAVRRNKPSGLQVELRRPLLKLGLWTKPLRGFGDGGSCFLGVKMWAARFVNVRSPLLSSVLLLSKGAPASSSPFHSSAHRHRAKVAVVLSGCGVYDGTEIHEASAIMIHLSRGGASIDMYAPNISQMHVVDHSRGQPADRESRNVLTESARIARGKIIDLARLTARDYDAVVFPGGFGAAKNLSTFSVDGKDCKVNKDVERVLKDFHKSGKPIGLCCISPVLAAKVLPGTEVTVGQEQEQGGKWPHASTAGAIKAMGGKHCAKDVTEAHVDNTNKIVTTPAFMCETEFHHIFDGIGAMIKNLLRLIGK